MRSNWLRSVAGNSAPDGLSGAWVANPKERVRPRCHSAGRPKSTPIQAGGSRDPSSRTVPMRQAKAWLPHARPAGRTGSTVPRASECPPGQSRPCVPALAQVPDRSQLTIPYAIRIRTASAWRAPGSVSISESGVALPKARFGFCSHRNALLRSPRMSTAVAATRARRKIRSDSFAASRACLLRRARVRFGIRKRHGHRSGGEAKLPSERFQGAEWQT